MLKPRCISSFLSQRVQRMGFRGLFLRCDAYYIVKSDIRTGIGGSFTPVLWKFQRLLWKIDGRKWEERFGCILQLKGVESL